MTPVHLQQWIQHPEALNRDTLYELRTLVTRYPYFQSLRLLYLKNLYVLHDVNFGAELRKAVLYVSDRRVLFYLIEGDRYALHPRTSESVVGRELEEEPSVDRTLSLIDAFLATVPEEHSQTTELDYSMDYTAYLMQDDEDTDEADTSSTVPVEVPKLRGQDLIDGFIRQSETEEGISLKLLKEENPLLLPLIEEEEDEVEEETPVIAEEIPQPTEVETEQEDDSEDTDTDEETTPKSASDDLDDSCFTETLAKIYIKQRRYDKALEIIKKLSSKGGGLASGFSSSNQIMGVRKTTDFLEKGTWFLAGFMVVMSIATAYVVPTSSGKGGDVILEQAQKEEKTNPYNMPTGTAAPQTEAPATTETPATTAPAAEDSAN